MKGFFDGHWGILTFLLIPVVGPFLFHLYIYLLFVF
jgi:hypothetical protein